jgi:hypothetical protein
MLRLQPLSSYRYPGDGGGNIIIGCIPIKMQPIPPYAPYLTYLVKRLTGRSQWPTPKVRGPVRGAKCNRHTGHTSQKRSP